MYGLPPDFDYSIFPGKRVYAVCFYEFGIYINFEEGLSIAIDGSYSHQISSANVRQAWWRAWASLSAEDAEVFRVPVTESKLMQLTGKIVESAEAEDPNTLLVRFTDGQVLKCFDDTKWYECFRIIYNGKETIV